MEYLSFNLPLFIKLGLAFLIFTVIGTLTHEMGHIAVANCLGYNTHLGYGYMKCMEPTKPGIDSLLIRLGGPLQTMLTGSFGLFVLFKNTRKYKEKSLLSFDQWFWIFITLFWLRQVANSVVAIGRLFANQRIGNSDESVIANYFNLPPFGIMLITGIIGVLILSLIYFKFIPKQARFTFLLAGLAGGILGYWFWLIKYGPLLMP